MSKIMKIRGLVGLFGCFLVGMMCVTVSNAATKCVAIGVDSDCSAGETQQGQTDWGATCGSGVVVHGVSVCGSWEEGRDLNGVLHKESIRYNSGTSAGNTSCFCKMIQPVVSRWIFAEEFHDENGEASSLRCTKYCAATCAGKIGNKSTNADFYNQIMGVLYE